MKKIISKLNIKQIIFLFALTLISKGTLLGQQTSTNNSNITEILVVLPMSDEPQLVTGEIINNLFIVEGDIILGNVNELRKQEKEILERGLLINGSNYRWPNSTIPYTKENGFSTSQSNDIDAAIAHINQNTNICLVQRTNEADYVKFTVSDSGCSSRVGRVGGVQDINLASNCGYGTIIHEICHAAGMWHEQSRSDRDSYINIIWDNIEPGKEHNFQIRSGTSHGPYNYSSIMHYGKYAFSNNGQPTIQSIPSGIPLGQYTALNEGDINALNWMYPSTSCNSNTSPNLSCHDRGTLSINGTNISISGVKIKNTGNTTVSSSTLGYYLSTNTTITTHDIRIGTDYVSSLSPGDISTESFSTNVSSLSLSPGTYYVGILADYQNNIDESSESDNDCYWTSPKLTIAANNNTNLSCHNRGTLSVNGTNISISGVKIKNTGNTTVSSSTLGYYLSTNTTITTHDIRIGTDYVSSLSPGDISTESFSTNVSSLSLSPGTYYVGILADYQDVIDESSESDNDCYWTSPRVTIPANNITNLTCHDRGTLSVNGTNISISGIKIKNTGNTNVNSSTLGYYLSTNTTITTHDIRIGTDYVSSLSPGDISTESFSTNVSSLSLSPGTYYVGILADYQDVIDESSESDNNCYWTSPRVTITEECICTGIYNPVCGSNGVTYPNACEAECAGVSYTNGACGSSANCECTNQYANYFCEEFDEYYTGKISPQSPCWTTWSGIEGGSEDADVGTSGGNKYLRVQGTNNNGDPQDVVLQLGNRTSGKYKLEFYIWVYQGEKGYYNILHRFNPGSGSDQWAQDVFFDGNGTGRLRTGGQITSFNYGVDKWVKVTQNFDINNNTSRLYIDGNYVRQWTFRYQNSTTSYGDNRLAAINFYPLDTDYRFFVDNMEFDKVNNFRDDNKDDIEFDDIAMPEENTMTNSINMDRNAASITESNSIDFSLYPNPVSNVLNFKISLTDTQAVNFSLINATGQVVLQEQLEGDFIERDFELGHLPNGIYFVRLAAGAEQHVKKISILK